MTNCFSQICIDLQKFAGFELKHKLQKEKHIENLDAQASMQAYTSTYWSYPTSISIFSLISTKIILTAAHCVQNKKEFAPRKADEATWYLGKNDLSTISGEPNFVTSSVSQFIIHPKWDANSESFDADIAISVLVRVIEFNKYVNSICLWVSSSGIDDLVGKTGTVAGWGRTDLNSSKFKIIFMFTII